MSTIKKIISGIRLAEASWQFSKSRGERPRALTLVGNPSVFGHPSGKVSVRQASEMRKEHTLRPVAEPLMRHLVEVEGITSSRLIGDSFGADKSAALAALAKKYGHEVTLLSAVEPTSIEQQPVVRLAQRLIKSGDKIQGYIDSSDWPAYQELRAADAGLGGLARFAAGMVLRTTNLSFGSVLAHGGFERRLRDAHAANQNMTSVTSYGLFSELVNTDPARQMVERVQAIYGADHVKSAEFAGHHASADDPNRITALYLHSFQQAA